MNIDNRKTCGVIDIQTNIIENFILADIDTAEASIGKYLIDLTSYFNDNEVRRSVGYFDLGWIYDPISQSWTDPNPQIIPDDHPNEGS